MNSHVLRVFPVLSLTDQIDHQILHCIGMLHGRTQHIEPSQACHNEQAQEGTSQRKYNNCDDVKAVTALHLSRLCDSRRNAMPSMFTPVMTFVDESLSVTSNTVN